MMLAAPAQLVWVDEITRHEGAKVNCSLPVVSVLSEYVPSALAVQVPVTCSDPVTGAEGQPAPTSERSRLPVTFRQDDVTAQAPTRFPPQAVTFGQDVPAPPVPEIPPEPTAPPVPDFPPVPDRAFDPEPQPHEMSPGPTAASAKRAKLLAIYRSVGLSRFVNGKVPETQPVATSMASRRTSSRSVH